MEPGQKPAVRFPSPFGRPQTQTPTKFGCATKNIQGPKVGASFLDFPSQPEKATPRPTHVNLDKTAGWTSFFISRVDLREQRAERDAFPALLPNALQRVASLRQALAELAILHWRLAIGLWSSRVAVLALRSEATMAPNLGAGALGFVGFMFRLSIHFCFFPSGSGARESVTVLGLKPFSQAHRDVNHPFWLGLPPSPAFPSPPPPREAFTAGSFSMEVALRLWSCHLACAMYRVASGSSSWGKKQQLGGEKISRAFGG